MLSLAETIVLRKFKGSAQALKGCVPLSLSSAQFLSCSEKRVVCIFSLCFFYYYYCFALGKKIETKQNFGPEDFDLYLCQNKWNHTGRIFFHCFVLLWIFFLPSHSCHSAHHISCDACHSQKRTAAPVYPD